MKTEMSKSGETSSSRPTSVEALLENVNDFIQSIYSDLGLLSPRTPATSSRVRNNVRNITPQPSPTLNSNSSSLNSSLAETDLNLNIQTDTSSSSLAVSPQNRHNLDVEIERINRICDDVDHNLRSIGVYVTGRRGGDEHAPSTGTDSFVRPSSRRNNVLSAIVDLSETQPETPEMLPRAEAIELNDADDDEVVVISSNLPPVIDLCTPGQEVSSRRPATQRNQLSRRVLDEAIQLEVVPVRRRRVSSATSGTKLFTKDEVSAVESKTSDDGNARRTSPERNPYVCPVCMDSFLRRRPTSTKCGHIYCEQCIKQAIRLTHKCPLCNTKISEKHLLRIYL